MLIESENGQEQSVPCREPAAKAAASAARSSATCSMRMEQDGRAEALDREQRLATKSRVGGDGVRHVVYCSLSQEKGVHQGSACKTTHHVTL